MIETKSSHKIVTSRESVDHGTTLADYTLIVSLFVLALLAGVSTFGFMAVSSLG